MKLLKEYQFARGLGSYICELRKC